MNKEELLKSISEISKSETKSCISSYGSINVDDLVNAVNRFNKIPSYNDLLNENQKLKEKLNTCMIERNKLVDVVEEVRNYLLGVYEMSCYTKSVSLNEEEIEELLNILAKYKGDN